MIEFIKRGLTYLRPYARLAIGAFASMLLVTVANLLNPQLFQQLIDDGIEVNNMQGILIATVGLLLIAIMRGIFTFANAYWSEKASQGIAYDMRNELFAKLERLSFSFHDTHNVGQLMTRATSDVEGVRAFFATGILQLVSAILTFIGSIVILLVTDWGLALAALIVIPLIVILFVIIFSRMGPLFGDVQKNLGKLNNVLQENIEGIRVIKGFTAESREADRYNAQNQQLYDINLGVITVYSLGFPTIFLLSNLATLIVIWFGGTRVIDGRLSLGTLIAFNSYLTFLVQPIFQLGGISQQLARAQASGSRIFEILDTVNEIESKPDAIPLLNSAEAHIKFNSVDFNYPHNEQGLTDIEINIPAGSTVALLGPTGSGKSSLINLVPRFYDVVAGSITIDGINVRDYELDSLRHQIGIVLQNVKLMSGTIRENIMYGEPDATQAEVEEAARIAQAYDFIMQTPDGFETVLGEGGSGLSGGQRQRVAIARTLVVHPRILIFDDSMSAVDATTEVKLRAALAPYLRNHTAFIIAQRISTVRDADQIVIMDKGRIVANGTHEHLLASSDLYADIVHSQLEDA